MDHQSTRGLRHFKNLVGIKFQLYNSLFTSLPFHRIEKTGILLSLLQIIVMKDIKKIKVLLKSLKSFFQNILLSNNHKND